jgi:hypothetical protein
MAEPAHCFSSRDDETDRPDQKTSGLGATEDQMNTQATIPQRTDQIGTKLEDLAGTGDFEGSGG